MNMVTLPSELRNAVAERLGENSCACSLPVALSLTLLYMRSTGRSIPLIRELALALSTSLGDDIIALTAECSDCIASTIYLDLDPSPWIAVSPESGEARNPSRPGCSGCKRRSES